MNYQELSETIDAGIDKHLSKASAMLNIVESILFIGAVILFLYFIPSLAESLLPELEKGDQQKTEAFNKAKNDFQAKFNKDFYKVSKDTYEEHKENNTLTPEIQNARKISLMDDGNSKLTDIVSFVSKLKVDEKKIEFILKILPYVLGVILGGFLFTYRLHVIVAKELEMKKIDLLGNNLRNESNDIGSNKTLERNS
jgi:hypothetical protein